MRESHDIPLKNRPFRHQHEISRDQLIAALQADELFTVFQPKIDLMTQRVLGCEALARWKSSNFGVIPPSVFVPLAERWDLMEQLTDQMLRNAVSAFADLAAQDPSFSVAVNISASSLTDISFPEKIERTLAEVGFPPKALILEVTESAVMTDVAKATDILVRLRIKGMGLAIDDFGTGYSSLTALVRMPFSEMKIDGSFVKDCNTDPDMAKIVQASMRLAHEFEMKTVAEGIEDSQVNAILRDSGCHAGQGYFFARPLEISRFKSWSANWSRGIKAAHPDLQLRAG